MCFFWMSVLIGWLSLSLYELYSKMYSLSKKKSKLSPADKNLNHKSYQSRNKSRTENSPTNKGSLSKDQIKNTIKKIVCQENSTAIRGSQPK